MNPSLSLFTQNENASRKATANNGKNNNGKVLRNATSTTNVVTGGREALANVTNLRKSHPGKSTTVSQQAPQGQIVRKKATSKGKTAKRPLELEPEKNVRGKRRKSDKMDIDEEIVLWEDIDTQDSMDPQAVSCYVNDIYDFMMEKEKQDRLEPTFMSSQNDINEKMRAILVDWLVEVHRMFKLLPETLYLAVYIIDHYLQLKLIPRDKLQLVGITSMLIASKYEEIYAPECNDFVYISDGAYTKEQILAMEQTILNTLNFNLTSPSSLHFLRRYSKAAGSDYTIHTLCKFIIELMLVDAKLLKFLPSEIAAGAVYIARVMTQKTPLWTPTLEHYTTYTHDEVKVVALEMNELLKRSQKSALKAIKKKYSTAKYCEVALLPLAELV